MPCKECGHATHPSQHTAPWILRFIKIHFNTTCWQIFPQGVHITNRHCSSNAFQTAAFPSSCPPPSRPNAKQRRIQEVRRHAILFCLMFDVVGRFVAPPTNQPTRVDRFSPHLTTSSISFEFLLPLNDASDATLGNIIDLRYFLTFFGWKKPSTYDYHCFCCRLCVHGPLYRI